jgi:ketosteroid isomerase-like protein
MGRIPDADRIREVAKKLDDTLESKDIDGVLAFFSDECEIEMLGLKLIGKDGARKWLKWLFSTFQDISFEPVTIMVDGSIFFEEFILKGKLKNGVEVVSKQAEVLVYEDYEVKSLRIYFDRLDFAEVIGKGPVRKEIVKVIRNASLKELQ